MRLSKVILILLAILLAAAGIVLGGATIYAGSDDARTRLAEELGKALKVPVQFSKMAYSFPDQLRAEGLTSVHDPAIDGQPQIAADAVHARVRLGALFARKIEVHELHLTGAKLDWPQTVSGKWLWPEGPKKPKTGPAIEEAPKAEKERMVSIDGVQLTHGRVQMLDAHGRPVIIAEDVAATFEGAGTPTLSGTLEAKRFVWEERFVFENFRTPFRYGPDGLFLEKIEGELFGGHATGNVSLATVDKEQAFKARVALAKVDLDRLATAAGWKDGDVQGRLTGEADVSGKVSSIARLEGPAKISIEDGRFKRLEIFEAIAAVLDLPELANLQPREATAQFQLRDEKAFIDPLVLATQNLRITAKGVARMDEKLSLDARLAVTDAVAKGLPDFARKTLEKGEDGMHGVDFKISGKTSQPKTDLAEKLIGGRVQDKVADLLGGLFGNKPRKPEPTDAKAPTQSASPAPAQTPSAPLPLVPPPAACE
jgi:type II secretion system protein N